jgi:tetratricopeptide (TPR) repeat protein
MLRRLGLLDESLEYAHAAYALKPSFQTAVAIAVAHESRRELEPAVEAYRDALRFEPNDVSARLSMADLVWDYGRPEEAEKYYAEALTIEPAQPWALPSSLYLRWQREGSEEVRFKLLALADACPDNQRAQQMAGLAMPYFGYLPEPSDATTNIFKQMANENKTLSGLSKLSLSCLEAPSNFLVAPNLFSAKISIVGLQKPDPRQPREPVEFLLWKYDDLRPSVAVPPPDSAVAQQVAELARQRYHLSSWMRAAGRLAQELGPQRVGDLLATMVHPPMPPEVKRPWGWIYRVQVAAALVVAQLDGGWQGSVRQKALSALVWGPMDWTVDAALVALSAIAQDEEALAEEVAGIFRKMLETLPRGGAVCYYPALLWCMLRVPGLTVEERTSLRQRLRQLYQVDTDEADTCYKLARIHEKDGEFDKAIEALTKALAARADFADALLLRGLLYLDVKQPARSVDDLTQLTRLAPQLALAYAGRAEANTQLMRLDEAVADFTEAIRLKPDDWHSFYGRGRLHAARNDYPEAIADFTQALTINPRAAHAWYNRGLAHVVQGRTDEALADLAQALAVDPKLTAAYIERASIHAARNELDRARDEYTRAIAATGPTARLLNGRAGVHYRKRDYANALADRGEALTLAPEDVATHNFLAWILATCPVEAHRDGPRAVELATRACELTGWQKSYCLDTLAAACAASGRFDEAVRHVEKVLTMVAPDDQQEYRQRLELYRAGKDYREG